MQTNRFITFEGGEGAGKSTQARLLADTLRTAGHGVVVTREPGGSLVAELIRALILAEKPASPMAEFLLFAAARAEHLDQTIAPALREGRFVICDRFIDSTRVYQGELGHVDAEFIKAIERASVAPYVPALTLVIDLPAETGMARAASRGDLNHYDGRDLAWHTALRAAFQGVAAREPGRCVLIDGARDETSVATAIWQVVCARLDIGAL